LIVAATTHGVKQMSRLGQMFWVLHSCCAILRPQDAGCV
jgi:hypothetical protein